MATTDEKSPPGAERSLPSEASHGERRRRAHDLLGTQRLHIDRLESELTEQLERLAEEVAQAVRSDVAASATGADDAAVLALQGQLHSLQEHFARLDEEAAQLRKDLEQTRLERGRVEHELRIRDALLKEAHDEIEARRVELAGGTRRASDAEAQLAAVQARQEELLRELAEVRDRAALEQEETKAQRRRIAREFKQQRSERIAEFERRRAELESLAAANQSQQQAAEREVLELRDKIAALQSEHQAELDRAGQAAPQAADSGELLKLKAERDSLKKRLTAAEAKAADAKTTGGKADEAEQRKRDDLQRRFEMAVEEVRELKRANSELESKLKAKGSGAAPALGGGGLDWEAQKQKLLASLEADDDDDEETVEERASIEATIRITDEVVAQKDREIAALKQQLEDAGGGSGADLAAVASLLDSDEIIRQEREKLAQAQAEWREKIGQAEIEISVQRAKIARERTEIDEKARQFQIDQDNRPMNADGSDSGKPTRGRWLARLGLKDLDEGK